MPLVSDQRHFFMDYMKVRIIAFVLYLYDNFLIMKQFFAVLIFLSFIPSGFSQNLTWKGYFSYNEIVDVDSGTDAVFAATQNAVFSKAITSSDLKIFNSINGLKPESITTIHHSQTTNKTFAGNTNGLLLIINSDPNASIPIQLPVATCCHWLKSTRFGFVILARRIPFDVAA